MKEALQNSEVFASCPSISIPALSSPVPLLPVEANPPRHKYLRGLISQPLSPVAVRSYEAGLRQHVRHLLSHLRGKGTGDLIPEFAFPVAAKLMFQPPLMGYPLPTSTDWISEFQHWAHTLRTDPERSADAGSKIFSYVERLMEHRRRNPQDDVPSKLNEEIDADNDFTHEDAVGLLFVLFMGGIETPSLWEG